MKLKIHFTVLKPKTSSMSLVTDFEIFLVIFVKEIT